MGLTPPPAPRLNNVKKTNTNTNIGTARHPLETSGATKTDEFAEKFQRGGGEVIFDQKIYVADFGP